MPLFLPSAAAAAVHAALLLFALLVRFAVVSSCAELAVALSVGAVDGPVDLPLLMLLLHDPLQGAAG